MLEDFDEGLPIDTGLDLRDRRRYARGKRCFELGVWGRDFGLLKGVELTTKLGCRNEWQYMRQDINNLRIKIRKEDWFDADCFCAEWSPKNRLIHLHGFHRLLRPMVSGKLHSILSEYWDLVHGAKVVWVQDIYSFEGLMAYNVKHALKNYNAEEFKYIRMLKTKNWLPVNWREVLKVMVRWALEHRAKWGIEDIDNLDDDVFGRSVLDSYVYQAWDVMNDYIRRWCSDENIILDFVTGDVRIYGREIIDLRKELVGV